MLDAPVSGGEPKAVEGTLSIMVGGDQETFDDVREVLDAVGSSNVLVGRTQHPGRHRRSWPNQVIVAVNIAAVSEALVLARQAGVSPQSVLDAIRAASRVAPR